MQRLYHLDVLDSITARECAVLDILQRKALRRKEQQQDYPIEEIDYTQYDQPQSLSDIVADLFPSPTFTDVPEGVCSPLCDAFWPVLRIIGMPSTITWNDIFKKVGYVPSEELGRREFGTLYLDTPSVLRVVSNIVKSCPAEVSS